MSDETKKEAKRLFDFVLRCYPDALIGLKIQDHPTIRRTYFYGVMKIVFGMELDQYVKMHLLNMLKNEIGMTAAELAEDILKYTSEQ